MKLRILTYTLLIVAPLLSLSLHAAEQNSDPKNLPVVSPQRKVIILKDLLEITQKEMMEITLSFEWIEKEDMTLQQILEGDARIFTNYANNKENKANNDNG
jgi:hypothetical protein